MSEQQLSDLEYELSQMVGADERMLLTYEIRFWKQRAWRAEQQRDRAEAAQKEAEEMTRKYSIIPKEMLDTFVLNMKEKELKELKDAAHVYMSTIGITNFRRLAGQADLVDCIDSKIKIWKDIVVNHKMYTYKDDEETD